MDYFNDELSRAKYFYAQNKFERAIEILKILISYKEEAPPDVMEESLLLVIKLNSLSRRPDEENFYGELARFYYEKKEFKKLLKAFEDIKDESLDQKNPIYLLYMFEAYANGGYVKKAEDYGRKYFEYLNNHNYIGALLEFFEKINAANLPQDYKKNYCTRIKISAGDVDELRTWLYTFDFKGKVYSKFIPLWATDIQEKVVGWRKYDFLIEIVLESYLMRPNNKKELKEEKYRYNKRILGLVMDFILHTKWDKTKTILLLRGIERSGSKQLYEIVKEHINIGDYKSRSEKRLVEGLMDSCEKLKKSKIIESNDDMDLGSDLFEGGFEEVREETKTPKVKEAAKVKEVVDKRTYKKAEKDLFKTLRVVENLSTVGELDFSTTTAHEIIENLKHEITEENFENVITSVYMMGEYNECYKLIEKIESEYGELNFDKRINIMYLKALSLQKMEEYYLSLTVLEDLINSWPLVDNEKANVMYLMAENMLYLNKRKSAKKYFIEVKKISPHFRGVDSRLRELERN